MFTIKDLKPGMLVKLVNGKYGVLIPISNGLAIIGRVDDRLSIYTETINLYPSTRYSGNYSVIEVYDLAYCNSDDFFLPGTRKCLWKYNDTKEMTIEEIEKALGYSIKIVKKN